MYSLPKLPYEYKALEPYIDARTMEIHYTKHHQAYVDKLNAALENYPMLQQSSVEDLLRNIGQVPSEILSAVQNQGGGHANHSLFWTILSPSSSRKPSGAIATAIDQVFTDFNQFAEKFSQTATNRFGSGWAWLIVNKDKKLEIISSPNQDSPLMMNQIPVLGLDVWEHAYYLNYQNRRTDYIQAFWNIVNWDEVERRYSEAMK